MRLINLKKVSLKRNPRINEKWIQEQISSNPSILGLGDLILKDIERNHRGAGRLDLLLQDPDSLKRYEVEIQLGKTDESHIIRTIEYWDNERKKYPQYDHCAVIIAEDITSRFFNVIQLFNGNIPIIAIQMNAYEVENNDGLALTFTKILDEFELGFIDEDEEVTEVVDRYYWEKKGSKETVELTDNLLQLIKEIDPTFELKYNKYYIGLAKDGSADNFVSFKARKSYLIMRLKLEDSEDIQNELLESGLDLMDYNRRSGLQRIRLVKKDLVDNEETIRKLMQMSYDYVHL
ncbi:hypothetical protein EFE41_08240 [Methanohalophilus portucalensis FDF-1]|uniref:DUF5655 domain-containing protein n=2 Tax=Methanohalophilus portucalensis TaxID=39664 RepID=A0A3M9LAX4_9EURY|nr:hypothetical protein BKM01_04290 [Methanohalophilus portucalensis]RNI10165.1 hypothetical protein EFE41_08240 [Methanohalophilus portucalensis FDF-1]